MKILDHTVFNGMGQPVFTAIFILLYRSPVGILSGLPQLRSCTRLVWFYRTIADLGQKYFPELVAVGDDGSIVLEIAARTGFTDAFTHIAERTARAADLSTSGIACRGLQYRSRTVGTQ